MSAKCWKARKEVSAPFMRLEPRVIRQCSNAHVVSRAPLFCASPHNKMLSRHSSRSLVHELKGQQSRGLKLKYVAAECADVQVRLSLPKLFCSRLQASQNN